MHALTLKVPIRVSRECLVSRIYAQVTGSTYTITRAITLIWNNMEYTNIQYTKWEFKYSVGKHNLPNKHYVIVFIPSTLVYYENRGHIHTSISLVLSFKNVFHKANWFWTLGNLESKYNLNNNHHITKHHKSIISPYVKSFT